MKKLLALLVLSTVIISCGENIEKKASKHLDNAKEAFSEGNFNMAKQEIDSIRILYPKAFEVRRQGLKLMQLVEEAEQMRTIEYEDSMIVAAKAAFEKIRPDFVFEKDENYQDIGLYTIKSQATTRNIDRNYIRGQVDEMGRMTLISHYRGSSYIHHDKIRLNVGEQYVETPFSDVRHEFTDLGVYYERLSFTDGNDGGAAAFIKANRDADIKYTLYRQTGPDSSKPVFKNLTMSKSDRYAIAQLYDLSQVLRSLEEHKKMRDEADRHLQFIRSKIKEEPEAESAENAVQKDK